MKIFTCYHKKYPICFSDVLVPIHVGKAISQVNLGFSGDDTNDNISKKNPYFCELTAFYWIWKNVKEDVVGLCHYRRYFNFKNDHTKINKIGDDFAKWSGNNLETIKPIFEQYDVVLPKKKASKKHPATLYDYYTKEHIQSDLDTVLDVIKEKYPDQYQMAYETLHDSTTGYYFNMLVAKKEEFDNYAKWLFDILFEVEKRIQKDVEIRDSYQKRVYGFLSERLMTVYIALHPELKIKEVPLLFIEEDKHKWYKYLFRYWRRKFFGLFTRRKNG